MMRIRALLLAGLIAIVPLTDAAAQSRGRDQDRDESRSQDRREAPRNYPGQGLRDAPRSAPRANPGDIARRVQSGRPGRMLGVQERGGDYVVRWEYPGGRVSDIQVDGQSGRVRGDD
ncbi:hypothetical protein NI456_04070 [Brevundimonas diminuta]|uniref:hypothetical protein n=1 Tax=Brevundimonas TaxID=41275 RepID=UPI0002A43C1F|nr:MULTISPECIES: hypothetical protein [Brevundimonas]EKY30228.1 hypothetical protein HMPREF0185_00635 [Brevundimonas diminuta 470-4]RJT21982.1 hypothetical protein D5I55_16185 [Chakrabartia godavariana]HAL07119.1 hypothetical protein [Brevundimonas sp.]MCO8018031.1 hypothetical protein [Brevundimonas diminuta]MCO8022444.1 hypothetical protein [Brevundimonas diminuta]